MEYRHVLFEKFTYSCYLESIAKILETHRQVSFVGELPEKHLILRHDVDYDLHAAMKMAALEADKGIHATYFVLLDSDLYNLHNSTVVQDLWQMGHRVGLHYDLSKNKDIYRQCEILSIMGNVHVGEIAAHNPSLHGKDEYRSGKWQVSAYADKFIKDTTYISDSCGHWRKGAWDTIPDKIQLNIHPVNWAESESDRWEKLTLARQRKMEEINIYMDYCVKLWEEHDKKAL
jgi:hypothetical protein